MTLPKFHRAALSTTISTLLLFTCSLNAQSPEYPNYLAEQPIRAQHAMVVTVHHDATDAGLNILHAGGNAVDAAVAVGFALAVVHPAAGNLGGGGFMLLRMSRHGDAHFIDFREEAPAAASANMYLDSSGNIIKDASTIGMKAIGVPGSVAGLVYAEKHFGRLTLQQVMQPAIHLASDGFVLSDQEALELHNKKLTRFTASKRIFQRDGNFYNSGDTFRQPELAETLRRIAADPDSFYHGALAHQIAAWMQSNGGLITEKDLAGYKVKIRTPLTGTYRGYKIITAPPSSSGGIALLETLNMLQRKNLTALGDRTPEEMHWIIEAFRRAYMDRNDYDGDTDFVSFPMKQMLDPKYAAAFAAGIRPDQATPSAQLHRPAGFLPAPPIAAPLPEESHNTTHFSIVDAEGNAVSMTYTLNASYGSGVTVDGLGFLLNDEMDDFTSKAGAPNLYGLQQSPNNSIAPYKRPLSCMTPTIVLGKAAARKKVWLVLGSPGGATIPTTVANDLISVIDQHLNIQQAVDAPRFHQQYLPDSVTVESTLPLSVINALKKMNYKIVVAREPWGDSEAISIDPKTGWLESGHDSRHKYGKAAGY
jgi:gamma-glutamyltranspeptidase/glutathione hydrolase